MIGQQIGACVGQSALSVQIVALVHVAAHAIVPPFSQQKLLLPQSSLPSHVAAKPVHVWLSGMHETEVLTTSAQHF